MNKNVNNFPDIVQVGRNRYRVVTHHGRSWMHWNTAFDNHTTVVMDDDLVNDILDDGVVTVRFLPHLRPPRRPPNRHLQSLRQR